MSSTYLYAELLSNIRSVSLYASLRSLKDQQTKAEISSDRKSVSFFHDGETATILLPTEIAGTAHLTIPAERAKELSFRLQVADTAEPIVRIAEPEDGGAPWPAKNIGHNTQIQCRACESQIVEEGAITTWKDLPSENWAEMMDFWHCHKPHDHANHNSKDKSVSRGYGAATRILAEPHVGLVDVSSFLLTEKDCCGVQISSLDFNGNPRLDCERCQSMLGVVDSQTNGWKFYKWALAVKSAADKPWETVRPVAIISSQLLEMIDAQAIRKFVVHKGKPTEENKDAAIILWVLNPDLRYSSSLKPGSIERAMKIFYRPIADPEALLKEHSLEYEELCLPSHILYQLRVALRESSRLLPNSARKFQQWDVGLIDRFSEDD